MALAESISAYKRARKSRVAAYILWAFLGWFGIHRFYLRRRGTAVLQLLTLGGFLIWWFIDLFLIGQIAHEENRKTAQAMGITSDELAEAGALDKEIPFLALIAILIGVLLIGGLLFGGIFM